MEILLTKSHKEVLINHAKKCAPNESCALLFGKNDSGVCSVSDVFLAQNVENSPAVFTISNEELLKGYGEAEEKKLDVVGIFHSHPNSDAIPSFTDRKFMEINPVVWVIFSNRYDDIKAYILEDGIVFVDVKII
jgi:proteasome lid subunit RPN8/RPN11